MQPTRRVVLLSLGASPFVVSVGAAKAGKNDDLLSAGLSFGTEPIGYDGMVSISASLVAKRACHIYYPLSWGYVWGLRFFVADNAGHESEPVFHPNFEHPSPASMLVPGNYRALAIGETVTLKDQVATNKLFPSRGRFKVRVGYVPEPTAGNNPFADTVLMEDGSIVSPWHPVTIL